MAVVWQVIRIPGYVDRINSALMRSPDYPNGGTSTLEGAALTVEGGATTTNRIVTLSGLERIHIVESETLRGSVVESPLIKNLEQRLRIAFDAEGSDKGTWHEYSYLYALIFEHFASNELVHVLEIGIGTTNPDMPSTMGSNGKPGASLRAFRDTDDRVFCVGLDLDPSVLFEEERIRTAVVDQMKPESWINVHKQLLGQKFDLVIDDGLHSPSANLNTLLATMSLLGDKGVIVVEDIPERSLDVWRIIVGLGIDGWDLRIIRFPRAFCVVMAKSGALPPAICIRG